MFQRPSRRERRALIACADVDFRTLARYFEGFRVQPQSMARIDAAIVELGVTHLLARPVPSDPDAAEDLEQ